MNRCHSITEAGYSNCLPHTGLTVWTLMEIGIAALVVGLLIFGAIRWYDRRHPEPTYPPVKHRW